MRLILANAFELTPQETYYWNYGRHLALGYFDHPGIAAWTIRLFCSILGDNAYAVRTVSLLYSSGTLVFVYLLTKRLFSPEVALGATLLAAFTPLFAIGGSIVTPDAPMIFFWTASLYFFYRAIESGNGRYLWLTGFLSGLAMLSKYPAVFLFVGYGIVLLANRDGRKLLKTPHPYIGLLLAAIAFSPEIIWNMQNNWASFLFQTTRRAGEVRSLRLDYFGGYLAAQILIVSPVLYAGLLYSALAKLKDTLRERKVLFLQSFFLPLLLFFSAVGLFYWVKMNWLAPAYIAGLILFAGYYEKTLFKKIAFYVALVSTVLLYFLVLVPVVPISGEAMTIHGWRALAERVQTERGRMPSDAFVFGWGYKVPSELAFYLPDKPETYSNDVLGSFGLQYHFWYKPEQLVGKDAIFITDKRYGKPSKSVLESHFKRVEYAGEFSPTNAGKAITTFHIWRLYGYHIE